MAVNSSVTSNILKSFQPFSALNEHQLLQLSDVVERRKMRSRTVIFNSGDTDNDEFFLLDGEVELTAADGVKRRITSKDSLASHQLSRLRPRQYTAKAKGSTTILVIDRHVLKGFSAEDGGRRVGVEVTEDIDEGPYTAFLERFHSDLLKNRCLLPSLPEIAQKIDYELEYNDPDDKDLAAMVSRDPAIAAKLLGAANCSIFYHKEHVDTALAAIARLGAATARNLVKSYSRKDIFNCRSDELQKRMETAWLCSTETAAIAYTLAKELPNASFTPDEAMFAGLLHDVGVIAILAYLGKNPIWLKRGLDIDDLLSHWRAETGGDILRYWHFPESLIEVLSEVENWSRRCSNEADLADVVQVAKLYAMMHNPSYAANGSQMPLLDRLGSLKKLQLGDISPEHTLRIVAAAKGEIKSAKKMLQVSC